MFTLRRVLSRSMYRTFTTVPTPESEVPKQTLSSAEKMQQAMTPMPTVSDMSFLSSLSTEQALSVRPVIEENLALRNQVRTLQALVNAQMVTLKKSSQSDVEPTSFVHNSMIAELELKMRHHEKFAEAQARTVNSAKQALKTRHALIYFLLTALIIQTVILGKKETTNVVDSVYLQNVYNDQKQLNEELLDCLQKVKSGDETVQKQIDTLVEKTRLLKIKAENSMPSNAVSKTAKTE